jgi:hypothetical protein
MAEETLDLIADNASEIVELLESLSATLENILLHHGKELTKPISIHALEMVSRSGVLLEILSVNTHKSIKKTNVSNSASVQHAHAAPAAETAPVAQGDALTPAARDVLAERQRQISAEGWTPEHDDEHRQGELSAAAGCYALYGWPQPVDECPAEWPWEPKSWKPINFRRALVKAGALILAELERLDRAAARVQAMEGGAQ